MKEKVWILIADDEDEIRRIVRESLTAKIDKDVRIVEAKDGSDASARLQLQAFDCIITDLKMPRKDGGQFINAIKDSQFNAKTPIIVLTGYPDESIVNNFVHITMLEKPIRARALAEEVENQLQLGRTDQRVAAHFLNSFLSGTRDFLAEALKQSPEVETPEMKTQNQNLLGDVICAMVIRQGKSFGRFALGFDRKLLLEVATKLLPGSVKEKKLDEVKVAKIIGEMLFNTSIAPGDFSSKPKLQEIFCFTQENHSNYKKLIQTKGITVEIKTAFGKSYAQALSGDDTVLRKVS